MLFQKVPKSKIIQFKFTFALLFSAQQFSVLKAIILKKFVLII